MSEPEQQAVVLAGVQKGDASGGKVVLKRPERHLAAVKAVPKQTELEEDEYIEGLSNIIKRDFFPDLDSDGARLGEAASVDISDMSLDKYQSRYTSEDNAAFLKLVEKHNQDIQRKHAWRFSEDKNELLLDGPNTDEHGFQGPRNYLDAVSAKSGLIEYTRYKSSNNLLSLPEATRTVADDPVSLAPAKRIDHASTRFAKPAPPSAAMLARQQVAAVAAAAAARGDHTPRVGGYSFVKATPSPAPIGSSTPGPSDTDSIDGGDGRINPDELMTWGEIDSTPLSIPSDSLQFTMPPQQRRERVAERLQNRASRSFRTRSGVKRQSATPGAGSTPKEKLLTSAASTGSSRPGSSSAWSRTRAAEDMSPAASALLGKVSTKKTSFLSSASGSTHRIMDQSPIVTPLLGGKRKRPEIDLAEKAKEVSTSGLLKL